RETFNGVWASASLLHLEKIADVQQALGEFLRVLKPKGVLYIQVKKQTASEKTSVVFDTLSSHERFFRWFDSQELLNLLEKAGFKFLSMEIIDDLAGRQEVQWICIFSRKP